MIVIIMSITHKLDNISLRNLALTSDFATEHSLNLICLIQSSIRNPQNCWWPLYVYTQISDYQSTSHNLNKTFFFKVPMERGLYCHLEFLVWSGAAKNNLKIDVRDCGRKTYLTKGVFDSPILWWLASDFAKAQSSVGWLDTWPL